MGTGRSRRAGRVAGFGLPGPAAHRPRRPPGRRAEHGQDLPEVPRRPARSRRSSWSACATVSSRRCATRATRSTCSRSRSSPRPRVDEWDVDELLALDRAGARTSPSSPTTCSARRSTCSPAATPPTSSRGLRPRVVWDRVQNRVRAREGAQRVAVASGGTIPDRGLFGVFLPDGARVGELDEEMVYESRVGECFVLGASTWRIEEITFDRVVVTPAPGRAGQDAVLEGRQARAARSSSAARSARSCASCASCPARRRARLRASGLDERAAANLRALPRRAGRGDRRGPRRPHDRDRALRRRDRRLARLHPHAVRRARCTRRGRSRSRSGSARLDLPVQVLWSDDGIICRLPESLDEIPLDVLLVDPDEIDELVVTRVPSTSLFASRFRENAARALLLPRRRPGERTPLWQQRQRAADLLEVACRATRPSRSCSRRRASASATSSTCRRCARCSPTSGRGVCGSCRSRRGTRRRSRSPCCSAGSRCTCTRATRRSPNAASPRSRSTATCCATCSAPRSCASCSIPAVIAELELELQRLVPERQARHADDLHDLLADLGPLDDDEIAARCAADPDRVDRRARSPNARVHPRRRARRRGRRRGAPARRARARDSRRACPPRSPIRSPQPLDDLVARYAPHARAVHRSTTSRRGSGSPTERVGRRAARLEARGPGRARRVPARRRRTRVVRRRRAALAARAARSPRCATRSSRSTR